MAETGVMWKRRTNCSVGLRAFSSMFQSCITISIHVRKGGNEEPGELSPGLQRGLSQNHCWRAAGRPDVFLSSVLISSILSMSFLSLKSTVPNPWYKTPESLVVQLPRAYEEWKQGPWRQSVRSISFIFIHLFIRSFIHPSIHPRSHWVLSRLFLWVWRMFAFFIDLIRFRITMETQLWRCS